MCGFVLHPPGICINFPWQIGRNTSQRREEDERKAARQSSEPSFLTQIIRVSLRKGKHVPVCLYGVKVDKDEKTEIVRNCVGLG